MWIRRIRRQGFKILLCNPSDKNLLRLSCQTSTMELLCKDSWQPKHVDCLSKKAPPQTFNWVLNADPTRGAANVRYEWNAKAWNLWLYAGVQGSGWSSMNPASGDSTGSIGLKKIRLVYLLDLSEGRGEIGQCNLVWVEHLWMNGLMVVMLMSYSHAVSVVLVLSGVGPVQRRWGWVTKSMLHCFRYMRCQ